MNTKLFAGRWLFLLLLLLMSGALVFADAWIEEISGEIVGEQTLDVNILCSEDGETIGTPELFKIDEGVRVEIPSVSISPNQCNSTYETLTLEITGSEFFEEKNSYEVKVSLQGSTHHAAKKTIYVYYEPEVNASAIPDSNIGLVALALVTVLFILTRKKEVDG